jgi:hypothetical protein
MAAIVLILAIFISARAGDTLWVQVWAAGLGVLAVARAVEILIEEKVKS